MIQNLVLTSFSLKLNNIIIAILNNRNMYISLICTRQHFCYLVERIFISLSNCMLRMNGINLMNRDEYFEKLSQRV